MAEAPKNIHIHVSSPSDVIEEREILAKVVAELQRDIALRLYLVRWEESAVPALGRPQEIINRQIPATDIFIGILWSRFGSSTAEGTSGTEEEIRRALDSWSLLGRPHVLIYFCDRPIDPFRVDVKQLARLQKFRQSIAEQLLVGMYATVSEFEQLVRRDLTRKIRELVATKAPKKKPPRLFYSYAHEDAGLREELAKDLRVLERKQIIESWYDDMIAPGAEWSAKIAEELEKANIVVLLISADFLDSDYCYTVEMRRALERHEAGDVCVLPVIVRSALWEESPLASLKALPKDGKPVTLWEDRDAAWTDVARGIQRIAKELPASL